MNGKTIGFVKSLKGKQIEVKWFEKIKQAKEMDYELDETPNGIITKPINRPFIDAKNKEDAINKFKNKYGEDFIEK